MADTGRHTRRLNETSQPQEPDAPKVIEMLRGLLEEGGYKPGMKLPSERALAKLLHVGRPALREGIKALGILDVLQSRRGDGTYLKSLDALTVGWPAKVEVSDGSFSILDLLEVRKMIEPRAAALAATRASEWQLRLIERERIMIEKLGDDWTRIGMHDFKLHAAIIKSSGNSILSEMSRFLAPLLRKSREITAVTAPDRTRMLNDHRAIVEAIVKGEAEAAEQAMLQHLHNVGLDLISDRKR